MFGNVINYLQKKVPAIPEADLQRILDTFKVRYIKKRKNLLNEGELCNGMYYVNEGLFRYYIFDEKGTENTIDFAAQNNWFGDAKAFLMQEPAGINIEALEDSQVFVLQYDDLQRLYDEVPMADRMVRIIVEQYFIKALERVKKISRSSYSAQERYQEFLRTYPKLVNRVPMVHLASYLGITPETLSRLRTQPLKYA